ncbi:hypothetical protein CR513_08092, partial [Mucuna pruriens]
MPGKVSPDKDQLVEVELCRLDECVCETSLANCASHTYQYDTIPLKLGARLPFTNFQCSVLKTLNIALTQLHPNGWAFVQALEILCEVRKGDNCSDCLLDAFGEPHFPLYWTSCLTVVIQVKRSYLENQRMRVLKSFGDT